MQGIIGETYERFTVGQEAFNPNSTYWLPEDVSGRSSLLLLFFLHMCKKGVCTVFHWSLQDS